MKSNNLLKSINENEEDTFYKELNCILAYKLNLRMPNFASVSLFVLYNNSIVTQTH